MFRPPFCVVFLNNDSMFNYFSDLVLINPEVTGFKLGVVGGFISPSFSPSPGSIIRWEQRQLGDSLPLLVSLTGLVCLYACMYVCHHTHTQPLSVYVSIGVFFFFT